MVYSDISNFLRGNFQGQSRGLFLGREEEEGGFGRKSF